MLFIGNNDTVYLGNIAADHQRVVFANEVSKID